MAVMIPRDCQTKVARAQKLLEEAYNAPILAPLQNAIIPQDVCELSGNLLDCASWRKLTGIAATCSKGPDARECGTMNSHVMPLDLVLGALVQRDALQKDEALVLAPTTEAAAVQERHPLDHDAVCTAPSDPTSQPDSQTETLPADCVLEAHTQMSAAQIEDLNSIVQAALEGAVAPLPRGAVSSLARILEATVGAALLTCLLPFQDLPRPDPWLRHPMKPAVGVQVLSWPVYRLSYALMALMRKWHHLRSNTAVAHQRHGNPFDVPQGSWPCMA